MKILDGQSVPVDSKDYDSRTALHVAAAAGKASMVRLLLSKNASTMIRDRWGKTAEDGALGELCKQALKEPVNRTAVPAAAAAEARVAPAGSAEMSSATKELLDAASKGDLRAVTALAKRGADCGGLDYDRRSALHIAAAAGHFPMVRFLIRQKNVVVNCVDRFGQTPLQNAAKRGFNDACAAFLVEHGATAVDQRRGFALCDCAANGDLFKLKELQMHGVNLSISDYDGRTALHLAAAESKVKVISWLLAQTSITASINAVDFMQQTPLQAAGSAEARILIRKAGGKTWAQLVGSSRGKNEHTPTGDGATTPTGVQYES